MAALVLKKGSLVSFLSGSFRDAAAAAADDDDDEGAVSGGNQK